MPVFLVFGLALAGVAAIVAVSMALNRPLPPPQSQAAEPVAAIKTLTLHLSGAFGPEFAGEMVAAKAGLFQRQGLQVALREGTSSDDSIAAVVNGTDTIGVADDDRFLIARANGAPIVAFGASFLESPIAFYVLKSPTVTKPADLVGLRVGVRDDDGSKISFDALVDHLGLPQSKLTEVPVGSDVSLLLDHKVDVWPGRVGQDDYVLTQRGAAYTTVDPGSYGVHLPGSVYFASEASIHNHPELIQAFLSGVIAGWQLTYANPTAAAPMIVAYDSQKMTSESVQYALRHESDYVRPLALRFCEFDDSQLQALQNVLLRQRLLDQPIDLSAALTKKFLDEAYRPSLTLGQ